MNRICKQCGKDKSLEDFHCNGFTRAGANKGIRKTCKICTNAINRASYYKYKTTRRIAQKKWENKRQELEFSDFNLHAKYLLKRCKQVAKKRNIPFNLTLDDIKIPDKCPVFDFPLVKNRMKMADNSASIDRIIPRLGYTKGNIIVVSLKANRTKNDATPDELFKLAHFYKDLYEQRSISG